MRIACLADTHLGYRTYPSTTNGRNTREVDTEAAWVAAVEGIVAALSPGDIVTLAGDVFHHPRVSDFAKQAFLDGVKRMLDARLVVVILQGNHDGARTSEVLTPIMLADSFQDDNLYVVTKPERIKVGMVSPSLAGVGRYVSVACFPYVSGRDADEGSYRLDPDPDADVNILVVHAAVKGSADGDTLPFFYGSGGAALDIGRESDRWDVVHCGDFHEFTRLHPTRMAFYSGSLERTSSNIWAEHAPKGWVLCDTETGAMELVEVPTRRMADYDLGDFDFPPGAAAEDVNACLKILVDYSITAGAIVRFKVDAFPRAEREHIDWAVVRAIKSRCTHFNLDIRYAKAEIGKLGDRRERGGVTLVEEAVAFFADDDEKVRSLAHHYLEIEAAVEDMAEEITP